MFLLLTFIGPILTGILSESLSTSSSASSDNNSTVVARRLKRQYFICGTYPNQFYSLYPCEVWNQTPTIPSFQMCENGGRKIGVGCYFNYQCTPYSTVATICLNNCCCTLPSVTPRPPSPPPPVPTIPTTLMTTQPSLANLAYCYNGQRTQVRCATSVDCAIGQTCVNAVCCTTTGDEFSGACAGLAAIAACNISQPQPCGSFTCTTSNYCCECQYGRSAGLCTNGCPSGYSCNSSNGYCCATCPSGLAPFGSCYNGRCANGFTCHAGNICC